jgi:indole-3-glycerol phosphate synthase
LFVLLEAFDAEDLAIAESIARDREGRGEQVLMGLNCRDLETLEIDPRRFAELRGRLPLDWPAVAESGVVTPDDAARVARLGYRMALVGTSLMRRPDPARAVQELVEAGRQASR